MGIYAEYLDRHMDWPALIAERKRQLSRICQLRGRPILVFASAMTREAPISIDYDDRVPLLDQLADIPGDKLDLILETPGGSAEVAEDIVESIRGRFSELAVIVPGYAKSAGTIMVMAADEILLEASSALGPIDAQVMQNGKRYSAHAFLQGLDKIKEEVTRTGQLNRAYIPILQNISPGEIQFCENALQFSRTLVTEWLSAYKFKFWDRHSSTGDPVTLEEKVHRAQEIAETLCDHGRWLTHGRSITMADLRDMRLLITDYGEQPELCDAIRRYYTLLKMSFDTTNIFKIYETPTSQIYRFAAPQGSPVAQAQKVDKAIVDFVCPNCKYRMRIQANFKQGVPQEPDVIPFPADDVLKCPSCQGHIDLGNLRKQIESQVKKRIVQEQIHDAREA